MNIEHTLCPSCSVGCGLGVICNDDKAVNIFPYKKHPVNAGKNCLNGRNSIDQLECKITNPLIFKGNDFAEIGIDEALKETSDILKAADKVCIVCSGDNTNEEIKAIKDFADANSYDIAFYADNFPNFNEEVASYKDIENASKIFVLGDVIYENPLIGRRIFHGVDNGAELYSAGKNEKSVTAINSNNFEKIDSFTEYLESNKEKIIGLADENSVIVVGQLDSYNDFDIVLDIVNRSNCKVIQVFSKPNTKGAMEVLDASSKEDISELLEAADAILAFNDDFIGE